MKDGRQGSMFQKPMGGAGTQAMRYIQQSKQRKPQGPRGKRAMWGSGDTLTARGQQGEEGVRSNNTAEGRTGATVYLGTGDILP